MEVAGKRLKYRVSQPSTRWYYVLGAVAVMAMTLGFILPNIFPQLGHVVGNYTATGQAAELLQKLDVIDKPRTSGQYKRDDFGFRKTDTDGNGCDVREDVLARDMRDVTYKNGSRCKVSAGVLDDPYTGKTINFTRGATTSAAVQIDHVVALSNAWKSGAYKWDTPMRYKFANDMYNLLAVDGPANQEKGDASADQWLPSNKKYECAYVARQIGVKVRYNLSVTSTEKDAMLLILHGCPGQTVPQE